MTSASVSTVVGYNLAATLPPLFGPEFVIYLLVRRSVLAGVIGAELILLGGKWWLG